MSAKASLIVAKEFVPAQSAQAEKSYAEQMALLNDFSDPVKFEAGAGVRTAAEAVEAGSGDKAKASFDLAYRVRPFPH